MIIIATVTEGDRIVETTIITTTDQIVETTILTTTDQTTEITTIGIRIITIQTTTHANDHRVTIVITITGLTSITETVRKTTTTHTATTNKQVEHDTRARRKTNHQIITISVVLRQ